MASLLDNRPRTESTLDLLDELRERLKTMANLTEINKEVQGVHATNLEMIGKIEAKMGGDVSALNYSATFSVDEDNVAKFDSYEEEELEAVDDLVKQFKFSGSLLSVPDHLNDKINYAISTFDETKKLSETIAAVSAKYEGLFEENNKKIIPILLGHADNIIMIAKNLKRLLNVLQDHSSKLELIRREVTAVNEILARLALDHGVHYSIDFGDFQESKILVTPGPKKALLEWTKCVNPMLIYRGSRDGLDAATFHAKCDGKAKTISIIKASTSDVFGGYCDIPWASKEGYAASANAFLFSLLNPFGTEPMKFPLAGTKNASAIYHGKSFGPNFGGNDLQISFDKPSSTGFPHAYKDTSGKGAAVFAGTASFTVADIEVWQI